MLLCPGQGGQHLGMFDLARSDPAGAGLLASLSLPALDAGTLFSNAAAQPLIVAAALATWEVLRRQLPPPDLVAGYSVGELAAWAVAGAVTAADAVALARARASAMDGAAAGVPQALYALGGLPVAQLAARAGEALFAPAILTGDDSLIAGGLEADAGRLEAAMRLPGARLQRLPVSVASHTPLMAAAVAPFAAALAATPFALPLCPVLSGIGATPLVRKAEAVEHLSRQLAQTIRWHACMDAAVERGVRVVLELGPGAALSQMMRARHPQVACRSVSEFRSVAGVCNWVGSHAG